MDERRRTRVSKFLSKYLRHEPEGLGLTLQPGGWVGVQDLLDACARRRFPITRAELDEVVATNDKQRFSFDEAGARIRANQGHSVPVDLELQPVEPPPLLYHGTPERFAESITREGLRKMSRHHVHLSPDVETATRVGARRGRPVIFAVDAAAMRRDGLLFLRSGNGVWLTDHVPAHYLHRLERT